MHQLVHWWDDEVFEQCPTWEACIRTGKIPRPDLERYFGEADQGGPGNYANAVKYGIGRRVLAKALEGTETRSAIEEALRILPMTDRLAAARPFPPFPPVPMGGASAAEIVQGFYILVEKLYSSRSQILVQAKPSSRKAAFLLTIFRNSNF